MKCVHYQQFSCGVDTRTVFPCGTSSPHPQHAPLSAPRPLMRCLLPCRKDNFPVGLQSLTSLLLELFQMAVIAWFDLGFILNVLLRVQQLLETRRVNVWQIPTIHSPFSSLHTSTLTHQNHPYVSTILTRDQSIVHRPLQNKNYVLRFKLCQIRKAKGSASFAVYFDFLVLRDNQSITQSITQSINNVINIYTSSRPLSLLTIREKVSNIHVVVTLHSRQRHSLPYKG